MCRKQVSGCGDPTDVGGSGDPRLTARHHAPTLAAPSGETVLGPGGTGERDGLLYVPASYDPSTPAPLFVALHGTPGGASLWTGFYPACEARGMIMLAPESRGFAWDRIELGRYGIDAPFISEALNFTFDRCLIDPQRIALGGFSDGGSYTLSLGPSNGDLFTHLIAFSPGFSSPGGPPVGRPKVFISHGIEDPVLSIVASRIEIVPVLLANGYDVTYEEFTGVHEVPPEIASLALDWFVG